MFDDIAEDMIKELGAKDALMRALAHMCGQSEAVKQRSMLCGIEGFVTCTIHVNEKGDYPESLENKGNAFFLLRKVFSDNICNNIRGMRICKGNMAACFDVSARHQDFIE